MPILSAAGIGVLVTDHNVRETLAVTDRAYIINDGKIFGEPADSATELSRRIREVLGRDCYLG